jgi:formate hydrogenlyase subunit 6/NADH:ubiquinone oxidoreductase subunit I
VLLRERCLVWEQDKVCLVCDEICPYDAIEFREVEGKRRPFVTETRCNGCGYCEHKCPVQGESAIVVARMGEMRMASGSYREAARERGYVFEGSREDEAPLPSPAQEDHPPPGFILKDR